MAAFHELSTAQLRQALRLREQIESLQQKLGVLLGGREPAPSGKSKATKTAGKTAGKRTMSAEARAKIGAAARARWAKTQRVTPPAKVAAKATPKKKGKLTAEGRAKIAAAMRARWAARKSAATATDGPV